MTAEDLHFQKGKNKRMCMLEGSVTVRAAHEFLQVYLMLEAKMKTAIVVTNVCGETAC